MSISEHDERQLRHMMDAITSFVVHQQNLSQRVAVLSALVDALEQVPEQWKDRFRSELGRLEQVEAIMLH